VDGFNKVLKASTSECKLIQSEQKLWLSLHEVLEYKLILFLINCINLLQYEAWNKRKSVFYWTARVRNPSIPITISSEHQDFRWCTLGTVLEISEHENLKSTYVELEKFLAEKYPVNER